MFLILISKNEMESENVKFFEMNYFRSNKPTPPIEAASSDEGFFKPSRRYSGKRD